MPATIVIHDELNEDDHRETPYGRMILAGLQQVRDVYLGTVEPKVIRARRRRNRQARTSRQINRR